MKLTRWAIFNGLFYACIVAGIMGSAGAWSLATFFIWMYFIAVALITATGEKIKVPYPDIPRTLDVGFDVLVIGTLVWFGHWAYASLYLVTMSLQHHVVEYNSRD